MLIEPGCWLCLRKGFPAAFITKCVMVSNCPPFGPDGQRAALLFPGQSGLTFRQ